MNCNPVWDTIIVEEREIFRGLLGLFMQRDGRFRVVGEAAEGETALEACRRLRPQLLLVDLVLPDISGLALVKQLRAEGCDSRVLAVTGIDDGRVVAQAIAAGFHGYVLKTDPLSELSAALVCVAQGGTYLSKNVRLSLESYLLESRERGRTLSEREEQVLRLVASGKTNQVIATELNLSVRTVESHRYHLMHKLDLKDTASMVAYAIRQGFIRASGPDLQ